MADYECRSWAELERLITKHAKQREAKVKKAVKAAAQRGKTAIKKNVPVAFGELRESVHADGQAIVVDAPHAAAVNNGSRPHFVPLDAILAWVKLRGMQGLQTERQRGRLPGSTTGSAARRVSYQLFQAQNNDSSSVDAPLQLAKAIQIAIAKKGTKPSFFMEKSLPEIQAILDEELKKAFDEVLDGAVGAGDAPGNEAKPGLAKTNSGKYRQHADSYRGRKIQTDHQGRRFVQQANGKIVHLKH